MTEIKPVYAVCTYRADYVIAGIVCLGTFWLCCVAESSVLDEIMPVRGSMQTLVFCMYVCYRLLGFGVALLLQYFLEWLVTAFASHYFGLCGSALMMPGQRGQQQLPQHMQSALTC